VVYVRKQAVVFFQYLVGHSGQYKDFRKRQESKPVLKTVLQTVTFSYWDTVLFCIYLFK